MTNSTRLLAAPDVAARLGVSLATAYRLMRRLPGRVYVGAVIRLPQADLDRWIAEGGDRLPDAPTSRGHVHRGGAGPSTSGELRDRRTDCWLRILRDASSASSSPPRGARRRRPP